MKHKSFFWMKLTVAIGVLLTQYTNCDNTTQQTLLSKDEAKILSNTNCDTADTLCQTTGANKNDLELRILSSNPYMVVAGDTKIIIGGECNSSVFPDNIIRVKLTDPDSQQVIAQDSRSECSAGRFDVTLGLPVGFNVTKRYELQAELFAHDRDGKEYSNPYLAQKKLDVVPYR